MPNWGEHLLIANKLQKRIKTDNNMFLFGNILPDVQNGYFIKSISNKIPHNVSHYYKKFQEYLGKENYKRAYELFFEDYKENIKNPIVLGYFSHLVADYFWNNMFYNERCIRENDIAVGYINIKGELIKGEKEQIRRDKQREFEIFQQYIYKNHEMDLPEYSDDLSEESNKIEMININGEDVKKVIDYIKETREISIKQDNKLKIFKIEELEEEIDKTVDFIYDFLKSKKVV